MRLLGRGDSQRFASSNHRSYRQVRKRGPCWSEAQSAIDAAKPQAKAINVLQWLITADLLIEDGPSTDAIGAENVVRPAFERFGDFLVASEMLERLMGSNVHQAFRSGGQFVHLFEGAGHQGECRTTFGAFRSPTRKIAA